MSCCKFDGFVDFHTQQHFKIEKRSYNWTNTLKKKDISFILQTRFKILDPWYNIIQCGFPSNKNGSLLFVLCTVSITRLGFFLLTFVAGSFCLLTVLLCCIFVYTLFVFVMVNVYLLLFMDGGWDVMTDDTWFWSLSWQNTL